MDSANMLRMPLCSPVQGSHKFSSLTPSNTVPQWLARIGVTKVQGFRKGDLIDRRREDSPIYSLYGPRLTLLHRLQSQGVSR